MSAPEPERSYKLAFETRKGYLFVKISAASLDTASATAYQQEIAAKCAELNISRVMVFRDIPSSIGIGNLILVVERMLEFMPGIRMAFVNPFSENEQSLKFGISVAVTRGGNHRLFTNEPEAENWLLK